jgi:hypothetical protein
MNRLAVGLGLVVAACGGNDVDPTLIAGGGVGDGPIDGEINVFIIDDATDAVITTATVQVGSRETTVDADGLAIFQDVEGPQDVIVKADGYRSQVWVGVNGANVTIPIQKNTVTTPDQATLSGTIAGFDTISAPNIKAAFVGYSANPDLGSEDNEIVTPNEGNLCIAMMPTDPCNWTLASRTGSVALFAAIIDFDPGTMPGTEDDVVTVLRYAYKTGIQVDDGVAQNGIVLDLLEAGNVVDISIDFGTPPAGLPDRGAIVGIDLGADGVMRFGNLAMDSGSTTIKGPSLAAFPGSSYELVGVAGDNTLMDDGPQSLVIQRDLSSPSMAMGAWMIPPTGVSANRTSAEWTPIDGALVHSVAWTDATDKAVLEMSVFDGSTLV